MLIAFLVMRLYHQLNNVKIKIEIHKRMLVSFPKFKQMQCS